MSVDCSERKLLLLGMTEILSGIAILSCTFTMLIEADAFYYGLSGIGTLAIVNSLLLINLNMNPYAINYGTCLIYTSTASGFIATIVSAVFLILNGLAIAQPGTTESINIIMIVLLSIAIIQSLAQGIMCAKMMNIIICDGDV